jgi:CHAT domain-containing protein
MGDMRDVGRFLITIAAMQLIALAAPMGAHAVEPATPASVPVAATGEPALDIAKRARAAASAGHYVQAIELGQRALALARAQYGPRHEYVAYILDDLATWQYQQHRLDDALPLSREAVDTIRQAKGDSSTELASLQNNLASILVAKGQYKEAASLYESSYAIVVKNLGPNDERAAQLARNLGVVYLEFSRFDAAAQQFGTVLRIERANHGDESADAARAYLDLASVHIRQEAIDQARTEATTARRIFAAQTPVDEASLTGADVALAQIDISASRLEEAKQRLTDALARLDRAGGAPTLTRASVLYNLGWIDILRRQAIEAERVYKEVLAIYQRNLSDSHPSIGRVLHCLAIVYQELGQFAESERFYRRAIDIFTVSFGAQDASVAATRLEYSSLLSKEGRAADAIVQAREALAVYDKLPGNWDLKRGYSNAVLALALHRTGDLPNAAKTYAVALALMTKVRGPQSSDLPPGLTDLARIDLAQGRLDDATRLLDQAISIREKDGAATPEALAESLSEMANVRLAQGNRHDALEVSRRAVSIAQQRLDVAQQSLSPSALGEQREARGLFEQFLEIASNPEAASNETLLREMFEIAQLPHLSGTSEAISQMAVRFSAGDTRLASLVRMRQDAVEQWRALDRSVTEQIVEDAGAASAAATEQRNRDSQIHLAQSIQQFDSTLRRDYPHYAELTNPRPVPASTVQSLLRPHEALLLQVTSGQATYVFLVTSRALRFARTNLTSEQLEKAVDSIRKGLDFGNIHKLSELPPFDVAAAYLLYQRLFQPFERELGDVHHLVAIVDRSMQSLPLSVLLVTPVDKAPSRMRDFGQLDFLIRHFGFSIEPSVSSFVLLRSVAPRSKARKPFVGFGDPDLKGEGTATRGSLNDKLVTGVDPALLRTALVPLPETRDELTAVGHALQATDSDLYFGQRATKKTVMQADLASYRILAFATHGLLAGEFRGIAEPALVLTPPTTASAFDDGLLKASEIATLKLDADWVLLSACNTAAPEGRPGAEGLSGLAKAFFYAGSRALLVSHWSVASQSTEVLMTTATQTLSREPGMGRAEALRRAMLSMLDGANEPAFAHPIFWAPFVNVGEGGEE